MISRCSAAIAVRQRHRIVELLDQNDGAKLVPTRPARMVSRGRGDELAFDRAFDLSGEPGAVGDQDRLRARIMLGLRRR